MMDNQIVGIKYVGKKPRQEDTTCKSGAVWLPGQVHNFAYGLAKRLLQHPDCYAQTDIDQDGQIFMSSGRQKDVPAAAYLNLSAMSPAQLVHIARAEFDRVVNPEGKDVDQLRREVQSLMVNHSLDLEEAERKSQADAGDYRVPVIFQATPEEFAAIKAGTVKLALVAVAGGNVKAEKERCIEDFSKDELAAFASIQFGLTLDKRKSIFSMREEVSAAIEASKSKADPQSITRHLR